MSTAECAEFNRHLERRYRAALNNAETEWWERPLLERAIRHHADRAAQLEREAGRLSLAVRTFAGEGA